MHTTTLERVIGFHGPEFFPGRDRQTPGSYVFLLSVLRGSQKEVRWRVFATRTGVQSGTAANLCVNAPLRASMLEQGLHHFCDGEA